MEINLSSKRFETATDYGDKFRYEEEDVKKAVRNIREKIKSMKKQYVISHPQLWAVCNEIELEIDKEFGNVFEDEYE